MPLLPVSIYADFMRFERFPVDLWSLPAAIVDEVRVVHAIVQREHAAQRERDRQRQN